MSKRQLEWLVLDAQDASSVKTFEDRRGSEENSAPALLRRIFSSTQERRCSTQNLTTGTESTRRKKPSCHPLTLKGVAGSGMCIRESVRKYSRKPNILVFHSSLIEVSFIACSLSFSFGRLFKLLWPSKTPQPCYEKR